MDELKIYIKNMVCPRCIEAVQNILTQLNISYEKVELGQIYLTHNPDSSRKSQLSKNLQLRGFELLEPGKSVLISRIKNLIIGQIHYSDKPLEINFSAYLSDKLNHDYSYLSRLFSSVENITIEKFISRQKIEKVKELLFYDELSLAEIAYRLNYSSVAYLVAQFKKETGMTTKEFRNSRQNNRKNLDSI